MSTGNDYNTCDYNEFVKIIKNIQNSKEDTYVNIAKSLNDKYVDVSKHIIKLNDERIELLNKVKYIQSEYRQLMGEGEITPSVDIEDNSDDEDKIIVEPKTSVRGRKKKSEKPAKAENKLEEPIPQQVEEPVGELKKSKKTIKKEELKEEIVEEKVDEDIVEKEKSKKGKKK
jgi:hypothetical protein